MQDAEGFAVIWRNAQRARSELLGIWFVRLVSRLSTLSHADCFKLGAWPPARTGGTPGTGLHGRDLSRCANRVPMRRSKSSAIRSPQDVISARRQAAAP